MTFETHISTVIVSEFYPDLPWCTDTIDSQYWYKDSIAVFQGCYWWDWISGDSGLSVHISDGQGSRNLENKSLIWQNQKNRYW